MVCSQQEVEPERTSIHLSDTPRGSWASSIFDLKNSQADPLLPHLLERLPADQVDEVNDAERRQNRQDAIFCLYPPQPDVRKLCGMFVSAAGHIGSFCISYWLFLFVYMDHHNCYMSAHNFFNSKDE